MLEVNVSFSLSVGSDKDLDKDRLKEIQKKARATDAVTVITDVKNCNEGRVCIQSRAKDAVTVITDVNNCNEGRVCIHEKA